ncbi:hypothetical protein TNIN_190611, partial [Trichonephila inaurata madagascariensis]
SVSQILHFPCFWPPLLDLLRDFALGKCHFCSGVTHEIELDVEGLQNSSEDVSEFDT